MISILRANYFHAASLLNLVCWFRNKPSENAILEERERYLVKDMRDNNSVMAMFHSSNQPHICKTHILERNKKKKTKFDIHIISNPLRKHAYSNILKILQPKPEIFQINILMFFHISAQNIDCGYSLEPARLGEAVQMSTHNLCF